MGERTSSLSAGTNALIRLGAVPVTCAGDVLELFGLSPTEPSTESLGEAVRALLEPLGVVAAHLLNEALSVLPVQDRVDEHC